MSEGSCSDIEEVTTEIFYEKVQDDPSSIDVPMSEWSSLLKEVSEPNRKKVLASQGLYSPGSGELCIHGDGFHSDSTLPNHPLQKYPAITDPGISSSLLKPETPIWFGNDGQKRYLALCDELNSCPVGLFYRNLTNDEINLCYYGVNCQGVLAMAKALEYNTCVRRFNLTDNFLNDDACYHLGQMFGTNVTLQELILTGCRIGSSGMLRLSTMFRYNRTLVLLDVARNCLGDEGGAIYAKQIEEGTFIRQINLSSNNLSSKTALGFAEALQFNNKLTHLDLSRNTFLHIPSTVKMLTILAQNEFLEELNLAWNSLEGDLVAVAIKKILGITTLRILNIGNNKFRGQAVQLIASDLIYAKNLRTLDISNNPLSPEDALTILEKMLLRRVKLHELFLENINVTKDFELCLQRIRRLQFRKNFVLTYGRVLHDWTITGPDARDLILKRASYLGNAKKPPIDIPLYFLALSKEFEKPVQIKELYERIQSDSVPLDIGFVTEVSFVFPGPKTKKSGSVNFELIRDYIMRLWPDKKLTTTIPLIKPG